MYLIDSILKCLLCLKSKQVEKEKIERKIENNIAKYSIRFSRFKF